MVGPAQRSVCVGACVYTHEGQSERLLCAGPVGWLCAWDAELGRPGTSVPVPVVPLSVPGLVFLESSPFSSALTLATRTTSMEPQLSP